METKNHIILKDLVLFSLFLLTVYIFFKIEDVIFLFFAAFIISSAANPLITKLSKKFSRRISVLIFCLSAFLIFLVLFIPLFNLFINQLTSFLNQIPNYWSKIELIVIDLTSNQGQNTLVSILKKLGLTNWITVIKGMGIFPSISQFLTYISNIGENFIQTSLIFTKGLATSFIFIFSVMMISFLMLIDKDKIKNKLLMLLPKHLQDDAKDITAIIAKKVGGYVTGQIINMINLGTILFIILSILHVDYSIILAFIAGALDIIPVVGATLSVLTIAIVVLAQNPSLVVGAVLAYLITNWALDNFVKPFVFSKFLDLHPLILIFSFLICAIIFGFKGLIFAAPIAATFSVLVDEIYIKRIIKNS
jgi:predicted PurR-regulated permease PerM